MKGDVVPAEITIFEDRSFKFILKTPPAAALLKKAAGIAKGSQKPSKEVAGKLTLAQVEEIAKTKMEDLNTDNVEQAMKVVAGTARSMGVKVE